MSVLLIKTFKHWGHGFWGKKKKKVVFFQENICCLLFLHVLCNKTGLWFVCAGGNVVDKAVMHVHKVRTMFSPWFLCKDEVWELCLLGNAVITSAVPQASARGRMPECDPGQKTWSLEYYLPNILACSHTSEWSENSKDTLLYSYTLSQELRLQIIVSKFSSSEGIYRRSFEENVIVFLLFLSILDLLKGETMHLKRKTWRGDSDAITLERWEVENEKAIGLSFTATVAFYERD